MEEKERYEWNSRFDEAIKDNQTGDIVNAVEVLNKQDKRIKELEETNKVLSNELTKNSILKQDHIETCCGIPIFEIPKIKEENQQLKQELDKYKEMVQELQENNSKIFDEGLYYRVNYSELKQQLHELPKKIVEEIREDMPKRIMEKQIKWEDNIQIGFICNAINAINECLDAILKKYGEEDESK